MDRLQRLFGLNGMNMYMEGASDDGGQGGGGSDDSAAQLKALQDKVNLLTGNITTLTEDRDKFKAKHDEAEKHRKAAEKKAAEDAAEAARKGGDIEAIEASWQGKLDKLTSDYEASISSLNKIINDVTVGATATSIASELALDGSASVIEPHIQSRLVMELRENKPHITVLKDGRPSALTLEELKAEIGEIPAFAPILKGSSASGGGNANAGGGGGNSGGKQMKRSDFDSLNPLERSKFISEKGVVVD